MTYVKKHLRKGKNKKVVVKKHYWKTHRIHNGRREVFVDGFWKHDDYPNAPKKGWSYERLIKERNHLQTDLSNGLAGAEPLPARKFGLLTRRIRKIDKLLKQK